MMKALKLIHISLTAVLLLSLSAGHVQAVAPIAGEEALFMNSTSPDALILLDLSDSMNTNPAGGAAIWGESIACTGPFSSIPSDPYKTNCSRLAIAKRAIFDLMDDNDSNAINSQDEGSLGVRLGYMRFYNCTTASEEPSGTYSYTSGCNRYIKAIATSYSLIYSSINGEAAAGRTALAAALHEAKLYLDAHKATDSLRNCRKKFVILVSDGADDLSCGGDGQECRQSNYKRRRETVLKAKALADAGYKLFVIGFGAGMPDYLQNTLQWTAYYGGTDNPNSVNSGTTSALNLSALTSCQEEDISSLLAGTCNGSSINWFAPANDPGNLTLGGYAFISANADQLGQSLKDVINVVRQANYSFSQASVQSARTTDENHIYEGSFAPVDTDPFWRGYLKKYQINTDGSVGSMLWDAGTVLQGTDADHRTIKTYKSGALVSFTTGNITLADVGVTTESARNGIVGYIRGESTYNPENWKLGDVFRSTPISVGTPSAFFDDIRDTNHQFAAHRSGHIRSSALGNRLIVAGANDGQFHAFKTSDGSEAWSFIPPNLLMKLKNITHTSHSDPVALTHQYFVDGPVTVADAWMGSGDGTVKAASSWKTILVFGLGRGAVNYAWSSSSSCDSGISSIYDSAKSPNYCGYYALNLNDPLDPAYMWRINPSAAQAPYLGDPWSKMMVGRVRINVSNSEVEKWVGFIGAGFNAADCSGGGACDSRGKGLFVIDLSNGNVLWSYTKFNNSNMKYSIPAQPAIVDTDNDGFIDQAYIGDLGGNMWRFTFCRQTDIWHNGTLQNCGTSTWDGRLLFDASSGQIRPIFASAAVAKDTTGNLWVYWGTGDKTDPTASNAQEYFCALKDNDRTSTYSVSNIDNITADSQVYDSSKVGYRIQLSGSGQKILAEPSVFGGVAYFTTYNPVSGGDPCEQSGTASLYAVNVNTGGGILEDGARSMEVGQGIASAPVLSLRPAGDASADLYVTTSGGSGTSASTQRVNINPPNVANRNNMIYWKDMRLAP